jgi:endo-1,4-beta-xylanase
MGQGDIVPELKVARAADPNAELYINDYTVKSLGANSDGLDNLVKSLRL